MQRTRCRVTAVALLILLAAGACRQPGAGPGGGSVQRKKIKSTWPKHTQLPLWFNSLEEWFQENPDMRGRVFIASGDGADDPEARDKAWERARQLVPPEHLYDLALLGSVQIFYHDDSRGVRLLLESTKAGVAQDLEDGSRKLSDDLLKTIPPERRSEFLTIAVDKFHYKNTQSQDAEFSEFIREKVQTALFEKLHDAAVARQKLLNRTEPDEVKILDSKGSDIAAKAVVTGTFWPWPRYDAKGRGALVFASIKERATGKTLGRAEANISVEGVDVELEPERVVPPKKRKTVPLPPHRLNLFLTKDSVPRNRESEVTLVALVATEGTLPHGDIDIEWVLHKQKERLKDFIADLREGYSDELKKRIDAWAQCVCIFSTKCQGGDEPCMGCSICTDMPGMMTGGHGKGNINTENRGGAHATCPVTGDEINKAFSAFHNGKQVYFCCDECIETFQANPAKYIGKLHDQGTHDAETMRHEHTSAMAMMICPPKNICLVIDVSGSMRGEKLKQVKSAAKESLRHYMQEDVFSLITFSDDATVLIEPTRISSTVPGLMMCDSVEAFIKHISEEKNPRRIERALDVLHGFVGNINSMKALNGTNIKKALELARKTIQSREARHLLGNPRAINRILLFSDGKHNSTIASPQTLRQFRKLAKQIVSDKVSISAFGVGKTDFDEKLMNEMVKPSLNHSGSYYYVRDVRAVYDLMWNDLMLVPAAKDVKVHVEVAPEIEATPLGAMMPTNENNPPTFTWNLKNMAWESKKTIAVRLDIPRSASRGARDRIKLADVTLEYLDLDGVGKTEQLPVHIKIGRQGFLTSENRIAMEQLIIEEGREALSRAVEALDRRNARKAGIILEQQITRFERWNYQLR